MPDERLSMREQLEASFSQHEGGERTETVTNNADSPAPKGAERQESVSVEPEQKPASKVDRVVPQHQAAEKKVEQKPEVKTEAKTEERPRDAQGKFVPKTFPAQWKKQFETHWSKPGGHTAEEWAAIQEEILRREGDHTTNAGKLQSRISEMEPMFKGFTDAITPYKDHLARRGVEPLGLIKQLLASAEFADRDFAGFVTEQARMRGFDLASLIQQQQDSQAQVDPAVRKLEQELAALKSTITTQQVTAQNQTRAEVRSQVEAFQNATNEDGSPKHPHFERVKVKMGSLMQAAPDLTLEQAYKDACYADPEVREAILADEWDQREKKRLAELERQKNAAKSTMGSTSGMNGSALPKGSSIRAQLSHAYDQLEGNARV